MDNISFDWFERLGKSGRSASEANQVHVVEESVQAGVSFTPLSHEASESEDLRFSSINSILVHLQRNQ